MIIYCKRCDKPLAEFMKNDIRLKASMTSICEECWNDLEEFMNES